MDKKVSCGFMKIGFEMNEVKKDMNNKIVDESHEKYKEVYSK